MASMTAAYLNISAKKLEDKDGATTISVTVDNSSAVFGLVVQLELFDKKTDKRILPTFYSNNSLNLLPAATADIAIQVPKMEGAAPDFTIRVDGWNLDPASTLGASGDVAVMRNENALAIGTASDSCGKCGA
jgi:mannosylglycoprotein endo-beta-mannosidase